MPSGMLARADLVGEPAEQRGRRVRVQFERLGAIEPAAVAHLVRKLVNGHRQSMIETQNRYRKKRGGTARRQSPWRSARS